MEIEIIKAGLLTTIQDKGRYEFRHIGVPVSGVMDSFAADIANILVGNEDTSALIEISFSEFSFRAISNIVIACTGPGFSASVNDHELTMWRATFIPAGHVVSVRPGHDGCRAYIAVAGGWATEQILNSSSTYLPLRMGGFNGSALHKGDLLTNDLLTDISKLIVKKINHPSAHTFHWGVQHQSLLDYSKRQIKVIRGHEWEQFIPSSRKAFAKTKYTVNPHADRMGYLLNGNAMERINDVELKSTAVTMGTIQVTNSGNMILLMADCQTTGGYPRVAQVTATDLPVCAQLRPGDKIGFELTDLQTAETNYLNYLADLHSLRSLISIKIESDDL